MRACSYLLHISAAAAMQQTKLGAKRNKKVERKDMGTTIETAMKFKCLNDARFFLV